MGKLPDWLLRLVRRKNNPNGPVGTVIGRGKFNRWWLVEWPDGTQTQEPERGLEVVEEAPK